jgi:ketosteroid isomerase-like protein
VRRFAQDTRDTFDVFQVEYPDVRDLGDRVLALGTLRIRGAGSGIETEVPSTVLARFRDGLITHLEDFGDRRRALEVAGLAE